MGLPNYIKLVNNALREVDSEELDRVIRVLDASRHFNFCVAGNGGSASNASHFAQDLSKVCGIRAMSLCDNVSYLTALANDNGYKNIFLDQLKNLDGMYILMCISGSGNSKNILEAAKYSKKETGWLTIGFTGFDGGKLSKLVDYHINVPSDNMGIVEGVHSVLFHYIVEKLRV